MDSFELNKIIGAILGTLLFVMGVGFLAEAIYKPIEGRGVGYALPMPDGDTHGGGEVVVAEVVPLATLLANASADAGEKVAKKCASCHTFEAGGANKAGPGLYEVVGRTIASHEGFAYSDVLNGMKAEGQTWTYESLDAFLASPKGFAPGTKMTFAGLKSEEDRADLLAYLQGLAASPVPFPAEEPAVEEAPTEAAEADAGASEETTDAPATTETPATTN